MNPNQLSSTFRSYDVSRACLLPSPLVSPEFGFSFDSVFDFIRLSNIDENVTRSSCCILWCARRLSLVQWWLIMAECFDGVDRRCILHHTQNQFRRYINMISPRNIRLCLVDYYYMISQWFVMLRTYLRVRYSVFLQQVLRLALIPWICALLFNRFFFFYYLFLPFFIKSSCVYFCLRFELQMKRQRDFYLLPRLSLLCIIFFLSVRSSSFTVITLSVFSALCTRQLRICMQTKHISLIVHVKL